MYPQASLSDILRTRRQLYRLFNGDGERAEEEGGEEGRYHARQDVGHEMFRGS